MLGFRDIQTGNQENCTRRPFNVYLVRLTVHPSFIFALRKLHESTILRTIEGGSLKGNLKKKYIHFFLLRCKML